MAIRRVYQLVAAPGLSDDLRRALYALGEKLAPLGGNEGVEILVDIDNADAYTFIERWSSVDSQKAAGAALGKAAFSDIGPTLGSTPQSASLALIKAWGIERA